MCDPTSIKRDAPNTRDHYEYGYQVDFTILLREYDSRLQESFNMAFNHGLPACLADMREFCEETLGVRVDPTDLSWLTKAVYNRLTNLEKYTYCLYALKCGSEDDTMVPPRYYKGIQHLSIIVRNLMEERADYWRRQSRTLFFVENISFRTLFNEPPKQTQDAATETDNPFAKPQDVRQQQQQQENTIQNQEPGYNPEQGTAYDEINTQPLRRTHPKLRRKPNRALKEKLEGIRETRPSYIVPAKRHYTSSPMPIPHERDYDNS